MKVVGRSIRQRPDAASFVLQSTEAMKAAVRFLSRSWKRRRRHRQGHDGSCDRKGDVHDIGKNLVDII